MGMTAMRIERGRWSVVVVAIVMIGGTAAALAACSSKDAPDEGDEALGDGQRGAPTTGSPGTGGGAIAGPTDLQAHEAKVRAVLARTGLSVPGDLAAWRHAALVEAEVDLGAARFSARWRYSGVNTSDRALDVVAFEVPVNHGAEAARVTLSGARVDGKPVASGGTIARWEVPVGAAPGARFEVELALEGELPVAAAAARAPGGAEPGPITLGSGASSPGLGELLAQLQGAPELAHLVPFVDVADGSQMFGRHGEAALLSGCWPRRVVGDGESARAIVELTVVGEAGLAIDAGGRRLAEEPADGQRHRFVSAGDDDVSIAVTRGLRTTTSVVADVPVTLRLPDGDGKTLLATARRALETFDGWWPAERPAQLTILALDGIDGVAAMDGVIVVPAELVFSQPERAPADPMVPSLSLDGLLGELVENHPAAAEAVAFAVATAIARQWWDDLGGASGALLENGFSRTAALSIIAAKGGDKARRRAIELGLRVPVQLALRAGARDVVLATADGPLSALGRWKAGLFAEALERHLGASVMRSLTTRLMEAGDAGAHSLTMAELRETIASAGPRPDETRALLARWLDETHLAEDVGPLRPDVLLEYLVADGAIAGLSAQLLEQLAPDRMGARAIELLGKGQELDAGLALQLLGEMAAKDSSDPAMKKWLSLGSRLLGGGDERKLAIESLVDDLADELGLPETEKSRLKQLSTVLSAIMGEGLDPAADDADDNADEKGP